MWQRAAALALSPSGLIGLPPAPWRLLRSSAAARRCGPRPSRLPVAIAATMAAEKAAAGVAKVTLETIWARQQHCAARITSGFGYIQLPASWSA
jgi:hypothetical protein